MRAVTSVSANTSVKMRIAGDALDHAHFERRSAAQVYAIDRTMHMNLKIDGDELMATQQGVRQLWRRSAHQPPTSVASWEGTALFNRSVALGAITVLALLPSACGSGKAPGIHGGLPSPSSPAASVLGTAASAERDALSAYRGLWDAFVNAAATSNAETPELRKYASDQALKLIASSLYMDQQEQRITKGQVQLNPKVSAAAPIAAPTKITITDCVSDEKWLKYKADGELVNDVAGGKHATTATVTSTPDGWRVQTLMLRESGTC